jgi:hypothetical protein
VFTFDPTVRPNNYTIPDTDTFIYYLVNNPVGGGSANLNLPHANVLGRRLIAMARNPYSGGNSEAVQVTCQWSDMIIGIGGSATVTSVTSQRPILLVSDGSGHWYEFGGQ